MHLEAGDIQGVLHGEIPPDQAAALKGHLDTCPECTAALAKAGREEAEIYEALMALDHQAPAPMTVSVLVGAAEAAARPPIVGVPWMRWAATIALGLGVAGVAYAAPGSPLREWIAALTERTAPPSEPPASQPAEVTGGGGVGVAPGDLLLIDFSGVTDGAAVRVLFTDAAELQAGGGSGQVAFTLGPGRLLVGPVRADTIQLEIPRAAPRVEVRSGDRTVAVAERGALLVDGAPMDGPGPFVLSISEVSP